MLINAIITAKEEHVVHTFGASILPPHKGDIIIKDKKEFIVTDVKQELRPGNIVLHVAMERKEN